MSAQVVRGLTSMREILTIIGALIVSARGRLTLTPDGTCYEVGHERRYEQPEAIPYIENILRKMSTEVLLKR